MVALIFMYELITKMRIRFSPNIFFYREKIKNDLVVPFVNMENLNWVKILLTSVSGDKLYGL